MKPRTTLVGISAAVLSTGLLSASYVFAQTAPTAAPAAEPASKSAATPAAQRVPLERLQLPKGQKYIYGWQLMTGAERASINDRLRLAASERERTQIRADHRAQMDERASKLGYSLSAEPSMKASRKISGKVVTEKTSEEKKD